MGMMNFVLATRKGQCRPLRSVRTSDPSHFLVMSPRGKARRSPQPPGAIRVNLSVLILIAVHNWRSAFLLTRLRPELGRCRQRAGGWFRWVLPRPHQWKDHAAVLGVQKWWPKVVAVSAVGSSGPRFDWSRRVVLRVVLRSITFFS